MTSSTSSRPAVLPGFAMAVLAAVCAGAVLLGHEGLRAAQVAILTLPVLLWLLWPVERAGWRRVRWTAAFVVIAAFLVDGAARAFLQREYQAAPDSSLVLAAAANTTARETLEYLRSQLPAMTLAIAALTAMLALTGFAITRATPRGRTLSRRARVVLLVLLAVCALAHLSKPWRRHHPLLFWPAWARQVEDLRASWADQQVQREQLMRNARSAAPTVAGATPSTVMLVLGESINRDNMSLYGYARPTTPELIALRDEEHGRLLTLRHAWSVEATTVASLSGLFSFGERHADDPAGRTQHLIALAKSAGYKVWWISNHDDVAVDQQHARLADSVEMINRQPGRSSGSLDGELLDEVETALADPAPRKLVVVHLLGAHPHYRLRMPPGEHPFDAGGDAVDAAMVRDGRAAWVREFRQDYDSAIRYHDRIVARTLRLTKRHLPTGGRGAWMFLSDHGQEVGHGGDHAGHSPGTASGYRIPALLWRSEGGLDATTASRPFRADWAGWTLAELMQLSWTGMRDGRNVLHRTYAWEAPTLPVKDLRFDR